MKGKTVGIDGTTREANAALRSIVRRDTGESHQDFLMKLAQAGASRRRRGRISRTSIGSEEEGLKRVAGAAHRADPAGAHSRARNGSPRPASGRHRQKETNRRDGGPKEFGFRSRASAPSQSDPRTVSLSNHLTFSLPRLLLFSLRLWLSPGSQAIAFAWADDSQSKRRTGGREDGRNFRFRSSSR